MPGLVLMDMVTSSTGVPPTLTMVGVRGVIQIFHRREGRDAHRCWPRASIRSETDDIPLKPHSGRRSQGASEISH